MPTVYNTRIKVSKNQINYRVDTNGGDAAPFQQEKLKLHFSIARIFHRVLNVYRLSQVEIFEKIDFEILGETLGKILFETNQGAMHKDLNALLRVFRTAYLDEDCRCRIYLEFAEDAGGAAMLPWEYLQLRLELANGKEYFIYPAADEDAKFDFIRSFPCPEDFAPPEPVKTLTVLVVVANCNGPHNVDEGKVLKNWCQNLSTKNKGRINFVFLQQPVDKIGDELPREHLFVSNIKDALKNIEGPYVLHYLGHGMVSGCIGSISFVEENGDARWIEDKTFANFFSSKKIRKPHIVALQACSSGQISQFDERKDGEKEYQMRGVGLNLCLNGIPAVVSMQNDISEEDSFAFFEKFYQSLIDGDDVAEAVTKGRSFLGCLYKQFDAEGHRSAQNYNSNIFGTPVLFLSADKPFSLLKKAGDALSATTYKICPYCQIVLENYAGDTHEIGCQGSVPAMLIETTKQGSLNYLKAMEDRQRNQGVNANAQPERVVGAVDANVDKNSATVQETRKKEVTGTEDKNITALSSLRGN